MDPIPLMLLFVAAGVVLLIGELLLPTHGLLGIAGLASFLGAIAVCFYINRWAGLAVLLAAILVSPLVWTVALNLWMRSPIGKRVVLQAPESQRPSIVIRVGDIGTAVTEHRPMGESDFGDHRLESISEHGIIRAGERVRVVAVTGGRPIVRRAALT